MIEKTWFKRILYVLFTIGCGFSGCVIYYGAKNGTLYSGVFEHFTVKALILGIPVVLCIIIDMIYHQYDPFEAFAWETSLGTPFVCLLIGYLVIGGKEEVSIFGLSVPVSVIYVLMYAVSLVITYLAGLLAIWTGEDERPKNTRSRPRSDDAPSVTRSGTGAYGFPDGLGPNHLPNNMKGPDY